MDIAIQVNSFQHGQPVPVLRAHVGQNDVTRQTQILVRCFIHQLLVEDTGWREMFGDQAPPLGHFVKAIVVGQQLFPRGRQILVGRQRCHQPTCSG